MKKALKVATGCGLAIMAMSVFGQSVRENDTSWTDTSQAVTALTVTNGAEIVLMNQKMILTSTTVAAGTNTITLKTPYTRRGVVVLQAKAATTNHIRIATNAYVRMSGTNSVVHMEPDGVNNAAILYITGTNTLFVIGGREY